MTDHSDIDADYYPMSFSLVSGLRQGSLPAIIGLARIPRLLEGYTMQRPDDNEGILDIVPGTKLSIEESAAVEEIFGQLLSQVAEEREDDSPTADHLRDAIGQFLQKAGAEVAYSAPLGGTSGAGPERSVFDIVASDGDQVRIIQVKATVSQSGLDEMQGHLTALRASDVRGKLYLGTDILNQFELLSGALRQSVKELMTNKGMGAILADDLMVMVCDSYDQLMLDEMPTLLFLT